VLFEFRGVPELKKSIAGLLVFALLASGVCASQTPDRKHTDAIRKKVSSCLENSRHVAVQTYDGRQLQGSVSEAGPEFFALTFQGNSTALNYTDVKSIKWPSPISKPVKDIILATSITAGLVLFFVLIGGLRG